MSGGKLGEMSRKAKGEARRAREAEALRANLVKRKAQAKARRRPESAVNAKKKPDGNRS